jgi:transposase
MADNKYNRRFGPEYKEEIVRLVEELGKSPVQVATDINVTPQTVRNWVKQYRKGDAKAFPDKGHLYPANEELRQMKKRLKDLKEENAILKKAMAILTGDGK